MFLKIQEIFLLHDYIPPSGHFQSLKSISKGHRSGDYLRHHDIKSYFKGHFFKCLIISESIGCKKVRDFQEFIHELGRINRLLVFICGCTAKVTLLRAIALQGCPGICLLFQLCPFALLFWQQRNTWQEKIY